MNIGIVDVDGHNLLLCRLLTAQGIQMQHVFTKFTLNYIQFFYRNI